MISASEFIHPEDAAALNNLESMPLFPKLVKKVLELGLEQMKYGINMASSIRLSSRQLPNLYNHLPPICQKLGIPEPEFYLEMNPFPNAYTFGDTRIYITITSGLVEMLNDEELDAVIAHECGHIVCRHVLYHSIATFILNGSISLGLLGELIKPVEVALLYWYRKSELSCDRCSSIVTNPETVCRMLARLAGGPRSITANVNMQEWAKQADKYDEIYNDGLWNKTLQVMNTMFLDHPYAAVRVREILKWSQSLQYQNLLRNLRAVDAGMACPNCHQAIDADWQFCKHCGTKLKN